VFALSIRAAAGTYAGTGQDIGFKRTYVLAAGQGAYFATGRSVNLSRGWKLAAAAGAYTYTGRAANLYNFRTEIRAAVESYAVTGQDANFKRGLKIIAERGTYDIFGVDVWGRPVSAVAVSVQAATIGVEVSVVDLTALVTMNDIIVTVSTGGDIQ
jgi:hypothetical protein